MVKFNKIYVFLFFILSGIRVFTMADNLRILIYITMIGVELLALVGLWGQAFKRYFFREIFWKIFIYILVAWETFMIYHLGIENLKLILFFTAFLLPSYIYIYIYAYKTNWPLSRKTGKAGKSDKGVDA